MCSGVMWWYIYNSTSLLMAKPLRLEVAVLGHIENPVSDWKMSQLLLILLNMSTSNNPKSSTIPCDSRIYHLPSSTH